MTLLLESADRALIEDGSELLLEDGLGGGATVPARIGAPPVKTSVRDVQLVASTLESLEVDVYSGSDPTDTPPEFATTTEGTVVNGSTTFSAGAWSSAYGSDGWATARTPQFGTAGTLTITSDTRIWVWIKTVAGDETAVWKVGTVIVL